MRLNIEILKSAVILANEHQSNQKKFYQCFSYKFSLCNRSRKNDFVNGMPENVAPRRIKPKWQPQYFMEYKAISIIFAGITQQYMDIYHTKKQTENVPRSCSYLLLKTLFYFISQSTSVPYLESGLCKLGKELNKCNFTFI